MFKILQNIICVTQKNSTTTCTGRKYTDYAKCCSTSCIPNHQTEITENGNFTLFKISFKQSFIIKV